MASLVCLDHATILRGGEVALRDFSWIVQEGETWAITGPTGSGKTTLAEVLLGRHHVASGTVRWPFVERLRAAGRSVAWPSEVIRHVTFREESHLFSYTRHYYQQRFNFIEAQDDLTLAEFLRSGTGAADEEIGAAATQLGLGELLGLSLIKLSNGQTRRARIARALLSKPELLILDEPFMGLDTSGREDVIAIVGELICEGTRVLLITQSPGIPEWVTHVLELDRLTARWHGPHLQWRVRSEEWGVR
jgi:molybdate transport system ATP-binding protein